MTSLFAYDEKEMMSLYNGLDPLSITQHLALYKLYPDQPLGEKALAHVHTLLQNCQTQKEEISNLPLKAESIEGFVFLMLGKSHPDDLLDEESLQAIETLASGLANRSLKGHLAQSEGEILNLENSEIDLSRAILIAQHEKNEIDWMWVRNYEAQLDFLALQVLARLPQNATAKQMIKEINQVLFFDLKYRYPNLDIMNEHEKFSQLAQVLDLKQGVCLGTSILYLCLAQRLNLPLEIVIPPGHIFVRHPNPDGEINIETTNRGIHIPSENYQSINLKYLKTATLKETIGFVYFNLGTTFLMDKNYSKAIEQYEKCLKYAPDNYLTTLMIGYTHTFNHQMKKAKVYFKKLDSLQFDDQITPIDLYAYQDFLNQKVDLETLEASILQPKKDSTEQVEERKKFLIEKLKKYPKFKAGWLMLANAHQYLGEAPQAIAALEQIHQMNHSFPFVEMGLASLYIHQLNYPKAWEHFHTCEAILKAHQVNNRILKGIRDHFKSTSIEP